MEKSPKIRFVKPDEVLLDSCLEALAEGPYINMALGIGDEAAEDIRKDPQGYLARINSPGPHKIVTPDGHEFVLEDCEMFWITDGERFLGTLPLRYDLDHPLLEEAGCGHVGLAIRPSLLNKGYGVKACYVAYEYALQRFREKGFSCFLASADPENRPSWHLIEHFGGKRLREIGDDESLGYGRSVIYRIDLEANDRSC